MESVVAVVVQVALAEGVKIVVVAYVLLVIVFVDDAMIGVPIVVVQVTIVEVVKKCARRLGRKHIF